MAETLKVGMAELKVARPPQKLGCFGVGSCVVVALHDPQAGLGGLAHAMLPSATGAAAAEGEPGAKFADTAVASLVQAMEKEGAKRERMNARLIGGATMFTFPGKGEPQMPLGERNLAAARRALSELGIPVKAEDSGGSNGRSLELEPGEGTLTVWSAFQYVRWL